MAENKTYYYLKLKEGFFDSEDMKLLQSMEDGYIYSDILLKLMLLSLRKNGELMYKGQIPYSPEMLSTLTGHTASVVENALDVLQSMKLIELREDGAILLEEIQNFIGKSSEEADRIRSYRSTVKKDKPIESNQESVQMYDKSTANVQQMNDKCTDDSEDENDTAIHVEDVSKEEIKQAIEEWNTLGLSQISHITGTSKRGQMLKARIREYGLDQVLSTIRKINESTFLKGQNKTGWMITIDWLVKPNNFIKVLEGNYSNRQSQGTTGNAYMDSIKNRVSVVDEWVNDQGAIWN